jgi:trk system potassium uptake protein TrkH
VTEPLPPLAYADPSTPRRPAELLSPGVLVPTFVLLVAVGYVLFARGLCTPTGNEISRPLSLMTAVNAATLTGFQQARSLSALTPVGQFVELALMVAGTLFSLTCGGMAVVRIARLPYRDRTVAAGAVAAVVTAAAVGFLLLGGPGRSRSDGAFLGISAFANAGLYLGQLPAGGDPRAGLLLLPLAVLGGLGVPVLLDLGRLRPSRHTWRVLAASAVAYLVTLVLLAAVLIVHGVLAKRDDAVTWAVSTGSREAINARSAGFPFQFVTYLPASAAAVLIVAMVVGGGPGGTAGGVKVTTVATLAGGARDAVAGRPLGRAFGLAVAWVAGYLGILVATWVALVMADPGVHPDRALFLAASAVGNVGLSHDPVVPSMAGMWVLSVAMLLGRIAPAVMLWTVADRATDVTEPIG